MTINSEIEHLLKNIQEGLKKYSIKELNEAIISFLNKKNDKTEEIDYVLEIVSKEYNISINALKRNGARGITQEAKQVAYCLLHFNIGITQRYIAKNVFDNWPNSVRVGIQRMKDTDVKLKQDEEFLKKYNKLQEKLILYFTKIK